MSDLSIAIINHLSLPMMFVTNYICLSEHWNISGCLNVCIFSSEKQDKGWKEKSLLTEKYTLNRENGGCLC